MNSTKAAPAAFCSSTRFIRFTFLLLLCALRSPAWAQVEPNEAPADSVVVFNEVMYHPKQDDPSLEWIELYNQMYVDVDLSNWSIRGGVQFTFPKGTVLARGAYLVVAADPAQVASATGLNKVLGPWAGRLNNAGDSLRLRNHNGRLMEELAYLDQAPWPAGADGSGATLAKTRKSWPSGNATHWRASSKLGGTPGRSNFPGLEGEPAPVDAFIGRDTPALFLIPAAADTAFDWTQPEFNPTAWTPGTASVGFDLTVPPGGTPVSPRWYFPLDSDILDASGNGFAADSAGLLFSTNVPPTLLKTRSGDFPGTSQYLQVRDVLDPTAYTLAAWVRIDATRASSVLVRTDSSGPTTTWSHQLRLTSGSRFEHYAFDGTAVTVTGTNVFQRSRWYHVAITARNNGPIKLYVNGVQDGPSRNVGILWSGGDQWRFGSNSGDNRNFFDGQLSDVALWDQVLPESEILRLSKGTSPALLSGLRGAYTTDLSLPLHGINSSAWLRVPFTLPANQAYDRLTLDLQFADGFVAWLNGQEVARQNAPDLLAWNSPATVDRSSIDAVRFLTVDLSARTPLLRPGTNVLAVQPLLFSKDSSNMLFSAQLRARQVTSALDSIPLTFHEVTAAHTTPAWVELYNSGFVDIQLAGIQLASGPTLSSVLPSVILPPKGTRVVAFSELPFPLSAGDRIHLLSADGQTLIDSLLLTARPQARTEEDPRGPWYFPEPPTPGALNQFQWHDEIVINELQYHPRPNYPSPSTPPTLTQELILPFDATWKYDNSGRDLGTAWKDPGYDDSGWMGGPAPLGTATGALPIPLRTPVPGNSRTTFYFRTVFTSEALPSDASLWLSAAVDDGAQFYLNGAPVHRMNLPAGTLLPSTKAQTNVNVIAQQSPVLIPSTLLLSGSNTLAVEVHQFTTNSTADFYLAARLHRSQVLEPGKPGEPYSENSEEWLELYNRSDRAVDLAGWRLADAVDYTFPTRTLINPGEYLVVARDRAAMAATYPDISVIGEYSGRLSDRTDRVRLIDAQGNPVDDIRYYGDTPWPAAADGNGSTLELKDSRSDNSAPEAWAASDESGRSTWQHYEFRATAVNPIFTPAVSPYHELRVCLLDAGEALIDNVSVVEEPSFSPRELIQNGTFDTGLSKWRPTGTHIRSSAIPDLDHPGNTVMRLLASGAGSYLNNLVETTFKSGTAFVPIVAGREYKVSFDAKWISGTPLLRWEFYYNKVAVTMRLLQPPRSGTPGRKNSRSVENAGPTFSHLSHSPAVPKYREPIEVSVQAGDPDGISSVTLFYSITNGVWNQSLMSLGETGRYRASLPAQSNSVQIQFYVSAVDARGARADYPAASTNSRAFIKIDNAPPLTVKVPIVRMLMNSREALGLMPLTNLLSDDYVECTLVIGEKEVIYGAGARLHGSMWSRQNQDSTGFNVRFPAGHAYKGVRTSLILRRRDPGEIVCRHMLANAMDVPGNYDEFVHLLSPLPGNAGLARVLFGNDDAVWLDSQYPGSDPVQVFKMEGIREFQATSSGNSEGYKLAMPIGWIQPFDIQNLGNDPEQYRWSTVISNHRDRDDYSRYIAMAKVFSLSGASLQRAVPDVMDINEWCRVFALQSLCGIADVYTIENPHNLGYLVRPDDGKLLALQNDWSFYFNLSPTTPLIGIQNLSKIFNLPAYKRLYYGNVQELLNTTYNREYMTRWVQHYSELAGESFTSMLDYIAARTTFAKTQFPKQVPFEILTGAGSEVATNSPVIQVLGRGWINVFTVALNGSSNRVDVEWLDGERWQTLVALDAGTNDLTFTAYDRSGAQVGEDTLRVVTTMTDRPQRDFLRISEIQYHPLDPSEAERQAGFADSDEFEFVELINQGPVPVALKGAALTLGVQFVFGVSGASGNPEMLDPGQRILVVKNPAAFAFRYPGTFRVAGAYTGNLNNGGELLRLVDALGSVIEEVRYGDSGSWPVSADGNGSSLERIQFAEDPSDPRQWQASTVRGGTPGTGIPVEATLTAGLTANGSLRLRAVLPADGQYRVEYRESLDSGTWLSFQLFPASGVSRVEEITDAIPRAPASRYYRLILPP